jgi:hypothetical protein
LSHRRELHDLNPVASSRLDSIAGIDSRVDMKNNAIEDSGISAQEPSQGTDAISSIIGGSQEYSNNSTLGLQSTSSNNSQSTADVSTPPTSTSDGFSSQSTNADGQLSQLSQLSQLAAAAQPMTDISAARPNLSIAPTAGHKRTADGQVKPTLFNSPTSPYGSKIRGHSRNTSAVSAASNVSSKIGEVNKGFHLPKQGLTSRSYLLNLGHVFHTQWSK